jgi:hypothetical protein
MGLLDMLQSDPDKQNALRQGLLNAGINMMASQSPNLMGSVGAGAGAGISAYQKEFDDHKKKLAQTQAMQAAITPERAATPTMYGIKGQPQRFGTEAEARTAANPYKTTVPTLSPKPLMPGLDAAMNGELGAPAAPDTVDMQMPEQQVETYPGQAAQAGGFDFGKFAQAAMSDPNAPPEMRDLALKYYASQKDPTENKPQLVTVYGTDGKPMLKWVRPGESTGVDVGMGKPDAEASGYKERTISPDGQTYIKQSSNDGGKTWSQIEGSKPYDIRASSGSSTNNVMVNGFPKEVFKNERDLRNDFQGLPTVKAYKEVQNSYDQINFALKNPSAANDLVAATKFMKMLDPGSVVRESELGMAMAATGQIDRMSNYYNMLKTGQKLTPSQRTDFYNSANGLYKAATGRYNQSANEYRTMAQEYQLNPDRIAKPSAEATAPKQAPKPGMIKDGYQFLGGDPANPKMWAKVKK